MACKVVNGQLESLQHTPKGSHCNTGRRRPTIGLDSRLDHISFDAQFQMTYPIEARAIRPKDNQMALKQVFIVETHIFRQ